MTNQQEELPLRSRIVNCFSGIETSPSVNTIDNLEKLIKAHTNKAIGEGDITANQLLNHIADGMGYDKTFTYTELEEALETLKEHKHGKK